MDISQKRICVLFGGQSNEYEISLQSASYIINVLSTAPVEVLELIGITKSGEFKFYAGPTELIVTEEWQEHDSVRDVLLKPGHQGQGFYVVEDSELIWHETDIFFPVLHGKMGEDGTIQGLFDLMNVPYVGCGVLASSVAMDKVASRMMFDAAGIAQADWTWLKKSKFKENPNLSLEKILDKLSYPIFVKPANAGSSVGINKANSDSELLESLEIAFEYDAKAVLEQAIDGREIEVAVLELTDDYGNIFVSVPGEIIPDREFYDYESKYISEDSQLIIPAEISEEQLTQIVEYAKLAFRTVDGNGLCRADFFIEKVSGRVLMNEINTLPGFTGISMYPKLMSESGYSSIELIEALISSAL